MLHFISQKEGIEKESKAEATKEGRQRTGVCHGFYFRHPCCRFSKASVAKVSCHSERKHVGRIELLGEFAVF